MDKDKLIDLLFAKNDSLVNKLGQIQTTLEQQREKSEELMGSIRTQIKRMEERAIAAERRLEIATKERMEAEQRLEDLITAITVMEKSEITK